VWRPGKHSVHAHLYFGVNPGYEIDWTGSTKQLCTPIETDLFGTTDMYCWWPGQAPDTYNNPDWNADCTGR